MSGPTDTQDLMNAIWLISSLVTVFYGILLLIWFRRR